MVPRETEAGKRAPSLGSRLHKQLRGSRGNGGGSSVQNAKQATLALFIYPTPSTLPQISQVGINEVRIQRRDRLWAWPCGACGGGTGKQRTGVTLEIINLFCEPNKIQTTRALCLIQ